MRRWPLLAALLAAQLIFSPIEARQHRSKKALNDFAKMQACPSTGANRLPCPGWVIDHIQALACGGADEPINMQWQTKADAKAKDKWERKDCKK